MMVMASNGHFCVRRDGEAGEIAAPRPGAAGTSAARSSLLRTFLQIPQPMHSSSETQASFEVAPTSMQSLPGGRGQAQARCGNAPRPGSVAAARQDAARGGGTGASRTHAHHGAALLALLPARVARCVSGWGSHPRGAWWPSARWGVCGAAQPADTASYHRARARRGVARRAAPRAPLGTARPALLPPLTCIFSACTCRR